MTYPTTMAAAGFNIYIPDYGKGLSFEKKAKFRWDAIQGAQNEVDFRRAELLNEAYHHYDCDGTPSGLTPLLAFINETLSVMKGKRTKKFIRFALAYETVDDVETWKMVGGTGTVHLANLYACSRKKVLRRVARTLKRTERTTVSDGCFRSILIEVLGIETYQDLLLENRVNKGPGPREKLRTLTAFLLKQAGQNPKLQQAIKRSKPVKAIIYPPSFRAAA